MRVRAFITAFLLVAVCSMRAATIEETFATDPFTRGWRAFGDASLFQWNAANQNLEVTWDSSRTNSYFHLPLGTVLSRGDDFSLTFDLRLGDIVIGTSPDKPFNFQIALGFLRWTNATATNFFRGAGVSAVGPRNLVEFNYFPDSGFGATFAPTIATTNNQIFYSHNYPLELTTGDLYRITLTFLASNRVLRTAVLRNGVPYSTGTSNTLRDVVLTNVHDFRVDTLAVMSYSDAVQVGPRTWWGSVLAHGTVDNLSLTLPAPPVQNLALASAVPARVQFLSRTNWQYQLERSTNLMEWQPASATVPGTGATLTLQDTNTTTPQAYYRVRAE
jgi:hypothetical protein